MQHAKDYGLSAKDVAFDGAAVVKRSRGVAGAALQRRRLPPEEEQGRRHLGHGDADRAGQGRRRRPREQPAEGRARRRRLRGQAHHRRDRRAAARAARHRAGPEARLDLFRGDGSGRDPEVAARHRLRRDRHRVRLVLPDDGRRGDGGRDPAADPSRRGRGDRRACPQALREGRHQDPHRGEGDEARRRARTRSPRRSRRRTARRRRSPSTA